MPSCKARDVPLCIFIPYEQQVQGTVICRLGIASGILLRVMLFVHSTKLDRCMSFTLYMVKYNAGLQCKPQAKFRLVSISASELDLSLTPWIYPSRTSALILHAMLALIFTGCSVCFFSAVLYVLVYVLKFHGLLQCMAFGRCGAVAGHFSRLSRPFLSLRLGRSPRESLRTHWQHASSIA